MAFSAKAVANEILRVGNERGMSVSPMKLQKLVYFTHGWHLAFTGKLLIDEQVECWQYGPVVRSLFFEFREFGRDPITRPASDWEFETKENGELEFLRKTPTLESSAKGDADPAYARGLVDQVWNVYGKYTAIQLSNITHMPGTPWKTIYDKWNEDPPRGTDIPDTLIREYFQGLREKNTAV